MDVFGRLPDESAPAWAAWQLYRDLPPAERSITTVAQELHRSRTLVGRWSARHNWVQRAAEWDAYLDAQRRDERVEAIREMARQHAVGSDFLLRLFLQRAQQLAANDQLGQIPAAALPRFLDVSVRVGRLSRGVPVDVPLEEAEPTEGGRLVTLGELFVPNPELSELDVARMLVDRRWRPEQAPVLEEDPDDDDPEEEGWPEAAEAVPEPAGGPEPAADPDPRVPQTPEPEPEPTAPPVPLPAAVGDGQVRWVVEDGRRVRRYVRPDPPADPDQRPHVAHQRRRRRR